MWIPRKKWEALEKRLLAIEEKLVSKKYEVKKAC